VCRNDLISDNMAFLTYKNMFSNPSKNANIYIAAFTTAHARLHLYEAVEKLDWRALYMDTDSVLCTSNPDSDDWVPKQTNNLGGWTDEVNGDDIIEFVTCGPKSYSCKSRNPRTGVTTTTLKVKGLRQTLLTEPLLNTETMKEQQALFIHSKRARPQEEDDETPDNAPKRPCLVTLQKRSALQQNQVNIYFSCPVSCFQPCHVSCLQTIIKHVCVCVCCL
jgi:hypothetical protein